MSKIVLGSKIAHYDELFLGATIGSLSLSGWDIPTREEMEGIATLTFSNMFKCAAGGYDVTGEVFETALTAHITTLICPTSVGGATIQLPHNMYTDANNLITTLQEGGLILNDKITQKPGTGGGGFFPEIVG